jgi:thimet oligopeptidase
MMWRLLMTLVLVGSGATAHAAAARPVPLGDGAKLVSGTAAELLASCRADIEKAKAARDQLVAAKKLTSAKALELFDRVGLLASDAGQRAQLAREVRPEKEARAAAEACEQEAQSFANALSLDRKVYDVLAALDGKGLDAAGKHVLKTALRDFRRAGVDRDEATRARIKALKDELVKLGQAFDKNISGDVRSVELAPADLDGLPDDFKRGHKPGKNGKVRVTTDYPDYFPFMAYATNAKAREALDRVYMKRGHPKNLEVLSRLLTKRHELATLLGFKSWADYVTGDKMTGSRDAVAAFVERITAASAARARRDFDELLAAKRRLDPKAKALDPWDIRFLANLVRREKYAFDAKAARPYFEVGKVKQGLLEITSKLYGIKYRPVPDAAKWHPDVEAYDVLDGKKVLGRIYFDLFPRENKYKHAAMFPIHTGKRGVEQPEMAMVCNFPKPGAEPALMEPREVTTFFHEYGHLLHYIFGGQNRWATYNLEWDFIEAPSQMFEEWTQDPAVLATFAKHYQTGQAIPADLVAKMRRADGFNRGADVRRQMMLASLSLGYHDRDPKGMDTTKVAAEVWNRLLPYKYVDGAFYQLGFGHLNGYSAYYYTYMWSLVIAKDLFTAFRRSGLMSPKVAAAYRHQVLEVVGTKPAAEQIKDFLGRPYDFTGWQDWIDEK